jgi:hypothetical protein
MSDQVSKLCTEIESLSKNGHIGILQILMKSNKHLLNENKNGVHVNLSEVDEETLDKIESYIKYVKLQESNLIVMEEKQETMKVKYF